MSKRAAAPYISGKTHSWIKVKCKAWQEANRKRYKLFEAKRRGRSSKI